MTGRERDLQLAHGGRSTGIRAGSPHHDHVGLHGRRADVCDLHADRHVRLRHLDAGQRVGDDTVDVAHLSEGDQFGGVAGKRHLPGLGQIERALQHRERIDLGQERRRRVAPRDRPEVFVEGGQEPYIDRDMPGELERTRAFERAPEDDLREGEAEQVDLDPDLEGDLEGEARRPDEDHVERDPRPCGDHGEVGVEPPIHAQLHRTGGDREIGLDDESDRPLALAVLVMATGREVDRDRRQLAQLRRRADQRRVVGVEPADRQFEGGLSGPADEQADVSADRESGDLRSAHAGEHLEVVRGDGGEDVRPDVGDRSGLGRHLHTERPEDHDLRVGKGDHHAHFEFDELGL